MRRDGDKNSLINDNKNIRVKPREDETKFEIEVLFNYKDKYHLTIILFDLEPKNSLTFNYYLTCEQDSEKINKFPIEDSKRIYFYENFPLFKYIRHRANSFIAKNREIFIIDSTKKITFDNIPQLRNINEENYFQSEIIYDSVNITQISDYKYEIEVAINKKGKYELDIFFTYLENDKSNSVRLNYYPILEKDSEIEYVIPIENIKLGNLI